MKLLLDENVPEDVLSLLRIKNVAIRHVHDTPVSGGNDEQIFFYAIKKKMTLVSFDKDFLDDKFYENTHYGIIFIVSRKRNLPSMVDAISRLITANKSFKNKVIIIE